MNILLVEDDPDLSSILTELLEEAGYRVDIAQDGQDGLDYALSTAYDMIVLDIMLPTLDGLSIVKRLRSASRKTPVLLLTAKAEVEDRILGLNTGADDYLTKPFATGELMARIHALSRRPGIFVADVIRFQNVELDKTNHCLRAQEKSIRLSVKEYSILEMLMLNTPNTISRERIMERVWGYDAQAEYNACDVYVSFLRKKLKAIGATAHIKSIRGIGYALEGA